MRLAVRHLTTYRFDPPLGHGLQRLRLTPRQTRGQQVRDWTMDVAGGRTEAGYVDHNANPVTLLSVLPGTAELAITCHGMVDTADRAGVVGEHRGPLPLWAFACPTPRTQPGPRLKALVAAVGESRADPLPWLHALSAAVLDVVEYAPGFTDAGTTAEEALGVGKGVCQDHAHVFIAAARAAGIPARYISGYLMMNDRVEQDATHAWAEAYVAGLGWVSFDVSNAISPDARYIRVASGRDYAEAAPVTGMTFGTGTSTLTVSLAVEQQGVQQ